MTLTSRTKIWVLTQEFQVFESELQNGVAYNRTAFFTEREARCAQSEALDREADRLQTLAATKREEARKVRASII